MAKGLGILGFAHGHLHGYCQQWRDNPEMEIEVRAGWDHDAERLATSCEGLGIDACTDADELLAREDIDAVLVTVETSMHADLVERAAAAGKAIVLQKPMALTMEQADRIVDAVEKHNVPFTMAWQMRVDPQNLKMKEMVESGEMGKVFMVRRRHGLSTHTWPDFTTLWHCDPVLNRDIFADDAAHPIDFIYWLLGMPKSVMCEMGSLMDPRVPNDNAIAIFRYESGIIAEVCCSFVCMAAENTTEIIAENRCIVQNFGDGPSCSAPREEGESGLKWYDRESAQWTVSDIPSPPGHGERISGLAGPISEFLHGKRPPIATVQEGRTSLQLIQACYESNEQGERIELL